MCQQLYIRLKAKANRIFLNCQSVNKERNCENNLFWHVSLTHISCTISQIRLALSSDFHDHQNTVDTPHPTNTFTRYGPRGLHRSQSKFAYKQTKYSLRKIEYGL